jgi:ubiquitin C-terminal hydrolase
MQEKISGIANLGNTCYMNSALQAGIMACPQLAQYFSSDQYLEDLTVDSSQSMAKAIAWLLDEVHNPDNRNAIYPKMVKSRIDEKIPRFRGTDQHDCSEFLMELLEVLHGELNKGSAMYRPHRASSALSVLTRSASSIAAMNGAIAGRSISAINWRSKGEEWWQAYRAKENSYIKKLFEGGIRSVMTCYKCGGVSARFEAFTSLIFPLSADSYNQTLDDLVHDFFRPEELDDIMCDYCNRKQIFHRTLDLWKSPPFLILTVSRFSFDFRAVARKVTKFFNYPLTGFNLESLIAREAPLQEYTEYDLYAVVEHEGTVNRGHYTAMIKVDGKWVAVNDARVANRIDESRVLSNNAYMLFYRLKVLSDPNAMFDLEEYLENS